MTKVELTIDVNYLPSWSTWEGIRELVQNARDAEIEFGAKMTIDWYNSMMRIENEGAVLPHEALLLGHSTKRGRSDMAGMWGEGLKLGVLALVRKNVAVKIRSGSEVWVPEIRHSDKFNADVLTFDIATGRKDENRVRIEIGPIDKETYQLVCKKFLFLAKLTDADMVTTPVGDLLLKDEYKGQIFVKGIWIQNAPGMAYGYNFKNADIDRDRRMVNSWDLKYYCQRVFSEAAARRPDLVQSFVACLEQGSQDVAGVDQYSTASLPDAVVNAAVQVFQTRHGNSAVPVSNVAESRDMEHLGRQGIVVPPAMKALLESRLGGLDKLKETLSKAAQKQYGWHELSVEEKANTEAAFALLQYGVPEARFEEIDIVDFNDAKLLGQFKDGRCLIAHKTLGNRIEILKTMVHEYAHREGGDGDKGHISAEEDIWGKIVQRLLDSPRQ